MAEKKTGSEDSKISRSDLVKSQANYTGNEHSDLVEVTFVKDSKHYKEGDTDIVHPTVAELFKAQGLIADLGKPFKRPEFKQKDVEVDA